MYVRACVRAYNMESRVLPCFQGGNTEEIAFQCREVGGLPDETPDLRETQDRAAQPVGAGESSVVGGEGRAGRDFRSDSRRWWF